MLPLKHSTLAGAVASPSARAHALTLTAGLSTARVAGMSDWSWPESLDALAAASKHHTLLFENERVRVLDTRVAPGETTAVHTHRWPSVMYVVSWGDFVRRDGDRNVVLDTRLTPKPIAPGTAVWYAPLPPHSLENVGSAEIHVITVELKDAAD